MIVFIFQYPQNIMTQHAFFTIYNLTKRQRMGRLEINLSQTGHPSVTNFISFIRGVSGQSFKGSRFRWFGGSIHSVLKLNNSSLQHILTESKCIRWTPESGDIYRSSIFSNTNFKFTIDIGTQSVIDLPKLGHISNYSNLNRCIGNHLEITDCGVTYR